MGGRRKKETFESASREVAQGGKRYVSRLRGERGGYSCPPHGRQKGGIASKNFGRGCSLVRVPVRGWDTVQRHSIPRTTHKVIGTYPGTPDAPKHDSVDVWLFSA